jgi:putative holliday junction resolvase
MSDVRPGIDADMDVRPTMRPGARIGIDVGSVRVGVAVSDPHGVLASPVETVQRASANVNRASAHVNRAGGTANRAEAEPNRADLARIADLVAEHAAVEVVVGLPLSLSGARGAAAQTALAYAQAIAAAVQPVPVRVVDERLSTVSAHGHLAAVGVGSRARRAVVDQAAAVIILQSALDAERSSGRAPGEVVNPS